MKVRALRLIASPWGTGQAGTIIDCPPGPAKALVAAGAAEYVKAPARAVKKVEAAVVEPKVEEGREVLKRKAKPKRKPRRAPAKPKPRRK